MIDTSVTTTTGATTSTNSTATLNFSGLPTNNDVFTMTDAANNSITFRFKASTTTVDGSKVSGSDHIEIGISGAGDADAVCARIASTVNAVTENVSNGYTLNITAAAAGSGGNITFTQDTAGSTGQTSIDESVNNMTVTNHFTGGYSDVVIVGLSGVSTNAGYAGRIRTTITNAKSFSNGYTLRMTSGGSSTTVTLTQTKNGVRGNTVIESNLANVTLTHFANTKHFDAITSNIYTSFSIASAINKKAEFKASATKRRIKIQMNAIGTASNGKTLATTATEGIVLTNFANGAASGDTIYVMDTEGSINSLNRSSFVIQEISLSGKDIIITHNSSSLAHTAHTGYIYSGSEESILFGSLPDNNSNSIKLVNEKIDRVIDWVDQRLKDDGTLEDNSVLEASIATTQVSAEKLKQAAVSPSNGQFLSYQSALTGKMTWANIPAADLQGWHGSTTRVKILPSDFSADDGGRPLGVDDSGSDRFLKSFGSGYKMFASLPIPTGYKATAVKINGNDTSDVKVFEADIDSKTVTSKGDGDVGTEINITDVTSDTTNYILVQVDQAASEEIYGGYMTIAAV